MGNTDIESTEVNLAAKIVISIVNKYPADFSPYEHEFVTRIDKNLNHGVVYDDDLENDPKTIDDYFFEKVGNLWAHEYGMLDCS